MSILNFLFIDVSVWKRGNSWEIILQIEDSEKRLTHRLSTLSALVVNYSTFLRTRIGEKHRNQCSRSPVKDCKVARSFGGKKNYNYDNNADKSVSVVLV